MASDIRNKSGFLKISKVIISASLVISKLSILLLILMLSFEVVMRYLFNRPTGFADELSGYFLAATVLLGAPHTLRVNGHVRVEILLNLFPSHVKAWLINSMNLFAVIPICLLTWLSVELVIGYYTSNRLSFASILQIPVWIPVSLVPLGLSLLILAILGEVNKFFQSRSNESDGHAG